MSVIESFSNSVYCSKNKKWNSWYVSWFWHHIEPLIEMKLEKVSIHTIPINFKLHIYWNFFSAIWNQKKFWSVVEIGTSPMITLSGLNIKTEKLIQFQFIHYTQKEDQMIWNCIMTLELFIRKKHLISNQMSTQFVYPILSPMIISAKMIAILWVGERLMTKSLTI